MKYIYIHSGNKILDRLFLKKYNLIKILFKGTQFMKFIKIFISIFLILFFIYIFNIYLKISLFVSFTILFTFVIIYKILQFSRLDIQLSEITQIALFSSLATMCRCIIKITPSASGFLPIIILSSSVINKNLGFILGAFSIFISNMLLGQGTWTPWQMVASGSIGYLAGFIFNNRKTKPSIFQLTVFYLICTIFIYCPIMNLFSFLLLTQCINTHSIITYFFPLFIIDTLNSIYSLIFLYILYNPIINTIRNAGKICKG